MTDGVAYAATTSDGSPNYALELRAANEQCITVPFRNVTLAETRMLWIRTSSTQTSGLFSTWLDAGAQAVSIELRMVQGRLQAYVYSGSAGYVYDSGSGAAAAINDGQWHHVAMVRSGGNISLYIDGVAAMSGTGRLTARQFTALSAKINSVAIGCRAFGSPLLSPLYFDGLVDDVRHYSVALESADITSICTYWVPRFLFVYLLFPHVVIRVYM